MVKLEQGSCPSGLTTPFITMSMVGMIVNSVRKMEEAYERDPANLKKYSGAKIPNAPISLDEW